MNPNSKQFKDLQSEWYQKLKESGFKDAEQLDGNMKVWDSKYFAARHDPLRFTAKGDYYSLATKFLHSYEFESPVEKVIWEAHSDGITIREIVKRVQSEFKRSSKDTVTSVIKRLAAIMLERYRAE